MDNLGGSSSVPGENSSILTPPESTPTGEAMEFGAFANQEKPKDNSEQAPLNPEKNVGAPEKASEVQSSAMPATAPATDDSDDVPESQEVAELQRVDIPRDAEELPKAYVAAVSKIVESDKRDPHQLVSDLDKARWDLLKKAYGRKLGDGLNGGGA